MEEGWSAFKILTGKPRGKRKFRCRWEDNIRMDLKEIGISMRYWVGYSQDNDYSKIVLPSLPRPS